MRQKIWRTIGQLAWSIALVAAAWGATEILYHADRPLEQKQHGVFAFFLAAVAIASWRGGLVPALFTLVLSSLMVAWMLPPAYTLHIDSQQDVVRLMLFIGLGLLIVYLYYARNRAEKSLQETDRRLHLSLDSSGVACWDVNVKEGTFWRSHNLPEIFGRSPSEFAKTYEGFFAYIHPEDREFFHLASIGGSGNHRDFEISHRIICGDGSLRRVSTRGRMYLDSAGSVERMVGAVFSVESKLPAPGSPPPSANSAGSIGLHILV